MIISILRLIFRLSWSYALWSEFRCVCWWLWKLMGGGQRACHLLSWKKTPTDDSFQFTWWSASYIPWLSGSFSDYHDHMLCGQNSDECVVPRQGSTYSNVPVISKTGQQPFSDHNQDQHHSIVSIPCKPSWQTSLRFLLHVLHVLSTHACQDEHPPNIMLQSLSWCPPPHSLNFVRCHIMAFSFMSCMSSQDEHTYQQALNKLWILPQLKNTHKLWILFANAKQSNIGSPCFIVKERCRANMWIFHEEGLVSSIGPLMKMIIVSCFVACPSLVYATLFSNQANCLPALAFQHKPGPVCKCMPQACGFTAEEDVINCYFVLFLSRPLVIHMPIGKASKEL